MKSGWWIVGAGVAVMVAALLAGVLVWGKRAAERQLATWSGRPSDNASLSVALRRGGNPEAEGWDGDSPLVKAARTGNAAAVRQLLAAGARVDNGGSHGDYEFTPLMAAALVGHPSVVRLLLQHGANPNARGYRQATVLMYGVAGDSPEVVGELLRAGAKVEARDADGDTALAQARKARAVRERASEICALLERHGAKF